MTDRFVIENGIVTDVQTGLEWELDYHGPMSWNDALAYAKALRLGGHADWRVPTVEELITLIDFSRTVPASTFPGMPSEYFWSSSSYSGSGSSSYAWAVNFSSGYVDYYGKVASCNVRCIRRGPFGSSAF